MQLFLHTKKSVYKFLTEKFKVFTKSTANSKGLFNSQGDIHVCFLYVYVYTYIYQLQHLQIVSSVSPMYQYTCMFAEKKQMSNSSRSEKHTLCLYMRQYIEHHSQMIGECFCFVLIVHHSKLTTIVAEHYGPWIFISCND